MTERRDRPADAERRGKREAQELPTQPHDVPLPVCDLHEYTPRDYCTHTSKSRGDSHCMHTDPRVSRIDA